MTSPEASVKPGNPVAASAFLLGSIWIFGRLSVFVVPELFRDAVFFVRFIIALLGSALPFLLVWAASCCAGIPAKRLLCGGMDESAFSWRERFMLLGRTMPVLIGVMLLLLGAGAFIFQNLLNIPVDSHYMVRLLQYCGLPEILLILVMVAVAAPLSEEIFFRRLLPDMLERCRIPAGFTIFVSSLTFALLHGLAYGVPALFFMSITLFRLRDRQDLLTSILCHSFYNIIVFIFALITRGLSCR